MRARLSTAACLLALTATSVSACGHASPAAVATVAGTPISKAALVHWTKIQIAGSAPGVRIDSQPGVPGRQRALELLIGARWTLLEAAALGVRVRDSEAARQLARFRYAQAEALRYERFPQEAALKRSLAWSGETTADQVWLMKLDLLEAGIVQERLLAAERQVTTGQIARYYASHRRRFVVPERRNFEILMTGTPARAQRARREIESGKPFLSVARRVSIDPEAPNGTQHLTRYEEEPEFVAHVFAAKLHHLVGPIHQSVTYYVFRLTRITPTRQQTLGEVQGRVRTLLGARRYRTTTGALEREAERRWAARTRCVGGLIARRCQAPHNLPVGG
jgi:parvulin-like peptidyl-prolyl isomerase